jgi:cytochrome bd ubiquinol oxidase subunit II
MAAIWFGVLAGLLIGYAVLDGFDLGAGALHLVVARTEAERRSVLLAIGPVWDGNQVWLVAWGATLFLAFPKVYASGFSGFYLPLMLVLWLLMGRGIGIELRKHLADAMWHSIWDVIFSVSSLLLALLYGVAVGNVVSGVPLNAAGYFMGLFEWMLNPYAILMGLFSLAILMLHGANYLSAKTTGELQVRTRRWASLLWYPTVALLLLVTVATFVVRPEMLQNFRVSPIFLAIPALTVISLGLIRQSHATRADGRAFLGSAAAIVGLLAATAIGYFPNLLWSSPHPERSLTIYNAASGSGSLAPALIWIGPGLLLLAVYEVVVYRSFQGKVRLEDGGHY